MPDGVERSGMLPSLQRGSWVPGEVERPGMLSIPRPGSIRARIGTPHRSPRRGFTTQAVWGYLYQM